MTQDRSDGKLEPSPKDLERLREIEHMAWHVLDSSEEDAKTGNISIQPNEDYLRLCDLLPEDHPEHEFAEATNAPPSASAASDEQEACAYCGEFYPKPVSHHHSEDECTANRAAKASNYEPLAWLHNKHQNAYVITERVRQLWLGCNPEYVENYTIPLFAQSAHVASEGATPRTDTALYRHGSDPAHEYARQLEREVTNLDQQCRDWRTRYEVKERELAGMMQARDNAVRLMGEAIEAHAKTERELAEALRK